MIINTEHSIGDTVYVLKHNYIETHTVASMGIKVDEDKNIGVEYSLGTLEPYIIYSKLDGRDVFSSKELLVKWLLERE